MSKIKIKAYAHNKQQLGFSAVCPVVIGPKNQREGGGGLMINRPFSIDALLDFDQLLPILDEIDPRNEARGVHFATLDQEMRYIT
jgi:hypothetical protein